MESDRAKTIEGRKKTGVGKDAIEKREDIGDRVEEDSKWREGSREIGIEEDTKLK
jgi:hypothetical protein